MTWSKGPLKEHCALVTKGTTPTSLGYKYSDQGIRFIRAQNIDNGRVIYQDSDLFIDEATDEALRRSRLRPGDVLISIAGTIGRVGVVPEHAPSLNCNQAVAILRLKDSLDRDYLRYWLSTAEAIRQIAGRSVTATISNLSLGQIKELEVPVPPLEEQRRIAEILELADGLRAKRREALAEVEGLTQAVFLEMFGKDSFPITTLVDIGEVQGGLQVSRKREGLPQEVPYLRVANVHRDHLVLDEIKTIKVKENEKSRTELLKGDLLVVEGHGNSKEVGRCAIWTGGIQNCVHQNHLIRVRCGDKLTPRYACSVINSSLGRAYFEKSGKTTSGLNTISTKQVREFKMPLPPVPLQQKFAESVEAIERLKGSHQRSLEDMNDLFASLQSRAFKGEL